MKYSALLFLFILIGGCEQENSKPKSLDALVKENSEVYACINDRTNRERETFKPMEILDKMSVNEPWIDLVISNRRKHEEICSTYASCLSTKDGEMSMIFQNCLKEIELSD